MQAIVEACRTGQLQAEAVLVISNNAEALALQKAKTVGIRARHISQASAGSAAAAEQQMLEELRTTRADLIVLSGYMRPIGASIVDAFPLRILNIHPALLPKYGGPGMYGMHVHRAVIAAKEKQSGISIHLVDQHYDSGPVLAQCCVPVLPDDSAETLAERIRAREPAFFVETLQAILAGDLRLGSASE